MHNSLFRRIIFIFLIPFSFIFIHAQDRAGIRMEIRNESSKERNNIIDLIVVVQNQGSTAFKGFLQIATPKGFRNILENRVEVNLEPGEPAFLPVKILVTNVAESGDSEISFNLLDNQNRAVAESRLPYHVAENTAMRITAENPVVYVNNENDSIEIRTRVTNLGNRKQNITLVCKVPDPSQSGRFVEKKADIGVQRDSVLVFRFLPSAALLKGSQFTVNIAAFREPDKEIFGNVSVSVQNVSSTQRYQYRETDGFSNYAKNSITASYRHIGENLDMYQLVGSGGFNLASGYVFARGNIYTINNQNDPIVTNTYVSYHHDNNTFTLGNISKLTEMSLFGRGAEYAYISSDKSKKMEVGFVDRTFSLTERNSFLKYGYGLYARGQLGKPTDTHSISGTYVYRDDPYEHAQHNLAGSDFQYAFGKDWKVNGKLYGGLSFYDHSLTRPSFAAESQYSGVIKKVNLNGNYFYSTDYYPGNRRGMLQIQQNISANIFKDYSVYGNLLISDFSPKFYFFDTNLKSNSTRLDAGLNFPRKGNFGLGLGLQYQQEKSNTYNTFFNTVLNDDSRQLAATRLTEYLTWSSSDRKHSAGFGLEAGLVDYPDRSRSKYQMKAIGNYNYKWLNVNFSYQYGSYFLSEYAFSKIFNQAGTYRKTLISAFVNQNFFKQTVNLNSGFSYTDDILYGKSPSGFVNLRYSKERYSFFLNSSWFNYASRSSGNNLFTIEAGVTLNLEAHTLNAGKKGDVHAFVYYDYNNNGVYDGEDKPAESYLIMFNHISFRTDREGHLTYKALPFGKYALNQIIQQGWYYNESEIVVNKHSFSLEIPLHQNGTLQGKIGYEFDSKTALEFTPKTGGILFNVYKNDKLLQRIVTDDNGEFAAFLESGTYRIELDENSLPANTYSEKSTAEVTLQAGKLIHAEPFIIKVKDKKIRVKKFGIE